MNKKSTVLIEQDDEGWPPPPSVPPPSPVPQEPFFVRVSLEIVILVDVGSGLATSGISCLNRWLSHKPIYVDDVAIDGVFMGLTLFGVHLWVRSYFKKRKENTAQEVDQTHS